jgi:hypothetical protein
MHHSQGGSIMSVSSISSVSNVYQNQLQQVKKDFSALQASLSSGDLTTAQNAYATLTQDLQGAQQTGGNGQISKDLAVVGSALQSGNITDAQSAFAALTQDMQSVQQAQGVQQAHKGHHHHHHGDSKTDDTSLNKDLAAVGIALQSGDLTTAQSAFTTLIQDLGNGSATGTSGNSTSLLVAGSTINLLV